MKRIMLLAVLGLLACRTGGEPAPGTQRLRTAVVRRDLPESVRSLLTDRMRGHSDQMQELFWSALFLDDAGVTLIAEDMSREPRLARPIGAADDSVNSSLPEEFFALQDELTKNAQALVRVVSERHDATAIGEAYGKLATTCVRCHERFLYGTSIAPNDRALEGHGEEEESR